MNDEKGQLFDDKTVKGLRWPPSRLGPDSGGGASDLDAGDWTRLDAIDLDDNYFGCPPEVSPRKTSDDVVVRLSEVGVRLASLKEQEAVTGSRCVRKRKCKRVNPEANSGGAGRPADAQGAASLTEQEPTTNSGGASSGGGGLRQPFFSAPRQPIPTVLLSTPKPKVSLRSRLARFSDYGTRPKEPSRGVKALASKSRRRKTWTQTLTANFLCGGGAEKPTSAYRGKANRREPSPPLEPATRKINVQGMDGEKHEVYVSPSDTVLSIKTKLASVAGVPRGAQQLYGGSESVFPDDLKVRDIGVQGDDSGDAVTPCTIADEVDGETLFMVVDETQITHPQMFALGKAKCSTKYSIQRYHDLTRLNQKENGDVPQHIAGSDFPEGLNQEREFALFPRNWESLPVDTVYRVKLEIGAIDMLAVNVGLGETLCRYDLIRDRDYRHGVPASAGDRYTRVDVLNDGPIELGVSIRKHPLTEAEKDQKRWKDKVSLSIECPEGYTFHWRSREANMKDAATIGGNGVIAGSGIKNDDGAPKRLLEWATQNFVMKPQYGVPSFHIQTHNSEDSTAAIF